MSKYYKYKLEESIEFEINVYNKKSVIVFAPNDKAWGHIEASETSENKCKMMIYKNYAWDGASPKINILDLFIFGIPDGIYDYKIGKPKLYYATLIHDFLYQFSNQISLSRKDIDKVFLDEMKKTNFKARYIYYIFVRLLGWVFKKKGK